MYAQDEMNQIEKFEITAAARIGGAIAVRPANQGGANTGWVLMPDADAAEINGEITDMDASEFLSEDGKCFAGDDEFNAFIESL